MSKLLIIILISLFLPIITFAKKDFKDGFIITLENDTLYQQIADRSEKKNYSSCITKKNGEIVEYKPSDIKGFGIINDKFYSSQIKDDSFVELIFQSDINVYKSKDHFYLQKNGKIYFLESNKNDLTIYREKNHQWKGIIIFLTSDCENFSDNLNSKIKLNEEELINLFELYKQCNISNGNY